MLRELKIDHVTVCGSDLAEMRDRFAKLGIETEYGGAHANQLTEMALAGFEDGSYLELIAPVAGADPDKASGMMASWLPLMIGNVGAGAWAIRVSGIQNAVEKLKERGVEVRGPERGGRTKPDGTRLDWEIAIAGPGAAGSLLPFMIEDRTERNLRVRTHRDQLTVSGVGAVVVVVRALGAAIDLYRQAYGWDEAAIEEHPEFGAALAHFRGNPVILAAPSSGNWLSERLLKFGEGPVAFLFKSRKAGDRQSLWFGQQVSWWDEQTAGARVGLIWD